MTDTYREWFHGRARWQDILIEDIFMWGSDLVMRRSLIALGFKTLGELDFATDADLLRLPGIGKATLCRIRVLIKIRKDVTKRQKRQALTDKISAMTEEEFRAFSAKPGRTRH